MTHTSFFTLMRSLYRKLISVETVCRLLSTLIMENLNLIDRKPNDDPLYINIHSNHPPSIIKQLRTSIYKCISALSADEQTFHESAPIYQNALRHSNFYHKLDYMTQAPQKTHRNRQRNII